MSYMEDAHEDLVYSRLWRVLVLRSGSWCGKAVWGEEEAGSEL